MASANNLNPDGRATVSRGIKDERVGRQPDPATSLVFEAALVPQYGAPLVLSPAAAERLGLGDHSYVGEILGTERPLSASQGIQVTSAVAGLTTLVMVSPGTPSESDLAMAAALALALVAAAVAATVTSLALARTQSLTDAATMEAVGATPSWIRLFSLIQSGVLVGVGLPLGALTGLALAAYVVRFMGAAGSSYWARSSCRGLNSPPAGCSWSSARGSVPGGLVVGRAPWCGVGSTDAVVTRGPGAPSSGWPSGRSRPKS